MNTSQSNKKRTLSTIAAQSTLNWFSPKQSNPSNLSYQSAYNPRTSLYSTLQVRTESYRNVQKQMNQMRRTFSAFKNSQAKVSTMKDNIFDLSQDINALKQKTKRSKLNFKFTAEQLTLQLKDRESEMKKSILALNKLMHKIIKSNQQRTGLIKIETQKVKESYSALKQELIAVDVKISTIEKQCGFITFASKVKR